LNDWQMQIGIAEMGLARLAFGWCLSYDKELIV
jgi:hypothetical protein